MLPAGVEPTQLHPVAPGGWSQVGTCQACRYVPLLITWQVVEAGAQGLRLWSPDGLVSNPRPTTLALESSLLLCTSVSSSVTRG